MACKLGNSIFKLPYVQGNIPRHLQRQMEMTPKTSIFEQHADDHQAVSDIDKKQRRLKHAKRWALFNRLIELDQRSLKDVEFRVLMTLFRHQRDGVASIPQIEIARQVGRTREAVSRAIRSLVKKELVVILRQGGQFGQNPEQRVVSKYHVL